ncbi:MAG: hypothetical protein KJO85_02635 [Gammaproteobacteria bacterium]|nr:hypothetical protein [Gammaproteobacteria bacterium]NNE05618.1 hypothetical protein [Xanthomonadales bacterium]
MNLKKCILALCWLVTPSLFAAGDSTSENDRERGNISFDASTEAAFDRSGNHITHSFGPDGVLLADHHGTMGSVTVARIGVSGDLEYLCTTDKEAAINFMSGGISAVRESTVELHLEER